MTGYLILTLGILCLAASAFILGGAWCAARGRDVGPQPKETPHRYIVPDEPHMVDPDTAYRMQDAESPDGWLDHWRNGVWNP